MQEDVIDHAEETPYEVRYARFWTRFGAAFIDGLILAPIGVAQVFNQMDMKSLPLFLGLTVVAILYKPWMEGTYGATLGKKALKIKVVKKDLQSISHREAWLRYIPWLISHALSIYTGWLLFDHAAFESATSYDEITKLETEIGSQTWSWAGSILVLIVGISISFDQFAQGIHDKAVGTYVIHDR